MSTPEFYAPAAPPRLGRPEDDDPLTFRVQDWSRRLDASARRVMLVDWGTPNDYPWFVVSGRDLDGRQRLSHDEVRDWPLAHAITYNTAYAIQARKEGRAAASAGAVEALSGDDLTVDGTNLFR